MRALIARILLWFVAPGMTAADVDARIEALIDKRMDYGRPSRWDFEDLQKRVEALEGAPRNEIKIAIPEFAEALAQMKALIARADRKDLN